jgi:hypothetical protein
VKNFIKEVGRTGGKVQQTVVGTFFKVIFLANLYSCMDCGTVFKAVFRWDSFVL